jgi:hypothetical protein
MSQTDGALKRAKIMLRWLWWDATGRRPARILSSSRTSQGKLTIGEQKTKLVDLLVKQRNNSARSAPGAP